MGSRFYWPYFYPELVTFWTCKIIQDTLVWSIFPVLNTIYKGLFQSTFFRQIIPESGSTDYRISLYELFYCNLWVTNVYSRFLYSMQYKMNFPIYHQASFLVLLEYVAEYSKHNL